MLSIFCPMTATRNRVILVSKSDLAKSNQGRRVHTVNQRTNRNDAERQMVVEEIGDVQAATFEDLVAPEIATLHLRALRLTHDHGAAEDLVQDTLERAYRKRAYFRPGTNLRGWLLCIMRNIWISNHRRQAGTPNTVPLDEIAETLPCQDRGDPPRASDVESSVIDGLSVAAIHLAIERLPAQIRQVVVLADVQETPYGIIAQVLAIPVGTVASRLSRGRRQLQRALQEQAHGVGVLAKAG